MTALDTWWTQPVGAVERRTGTGPRGDVYADADTSLYGRVSAQNRLIRTPDGREALTSTRISLPADTPTIPVGSRITRDGRTRTVIAEARHLGTRRSPNFYHVDLD